MGEISLNEADEEIRDCLRNEGRATPRLISEQTGYSRAYVSQRLDRLTAGELVKKVDRGLYEWHNTMILSGVEVDVIKELEDFNPYPKYDSFSTVNWILYVILQTHPHFFPTPFSDSVVEMAKNIGAGDEELEKLEDSADEN